MYILKSKKKKEGHYLYYSLNSPYRPLKFTAGWIKEALKSNYRAVYPFSLSSIHSPTAFNHVCDNNYINNIWAVKIWDVYYTIIKAKKIHNNFFCGLSIEILQGERASNQVQL